MYKLKDVVRPSAKELAISNNKEREENKPIEGKLISFPIAHDLNACYDGLLSSLNKNRITKGYPKMSQKELFHEALRNYYLQLMNNKLDNLHVAKSLWKASNNVIVAKEVKDRVSIKVK